MEEQQWYYLTHNWGYMGIHTFLKGYGSKVNITALLDFELTTLFYAQTLYALSLLNEWLF